MSESILRRWHCRITGRKRRIAEQAGSAPYAAAGKPRNEEAAARKTQSGGTAKERFRALDRRAFDGVVEESLRGGRAGGCLLLCDVDRYREINSIYGRETGDAVLAYAGEVLRDVFGEHICAGSFGGGKYALWLPTVSAERVGGIRRGIGIVNDRLLHPAGELPPVTISAGAAFGRADDDGGSISRRAYQALRLVKDNGNCGFEAAM